VTNAHAGSRGTCGTPCAGDPCGTWRSFGALDRQLNTQPLDDDAAE